MPEGFDFPGGSDYWYARERSAPQTARTAHNWLVIARLADHVALERTVAELSTVSRALKQQYGDATWMSDATALPLREQLTAAAKPTLLMLFGAAMLLLVIACLNVSNLQLARASTRRRELAVRLAVGAGTSRLARQLFAEAIVLSAVATLVGVALAFGGVRMLVALQPANLPRIENVDVDILALLFASVAALSTAVALGLASALRASKPDVREALCRGHAQPGWRQEHRTAAPDPGRRPGGVDHRAARRRRPAGAQLHQRDGRGSRLRNRPRPGRRHAVDVLRRPARPSAAQSHPTGRARAVARAARCAARRPDQRLSAGHRRFLQRPVHRNDASRRAADP